MAKIGNIVIENAYALPSLPDVKTSACYMTFRNGTNETDWLIKVAPADSKQSFKMAMPMTFSIDDAGTWSMISLNPQTKPPKYFEIASGVPTVLTPGYAHIMLMQLERPLLPGETLSLSLGFVNNGSGNIDVNVIT